VENLKKQRPCAFCARCGQVWYPEDNPKFGGLHQCDPARPEKGAIASRLGPQDWFDCWSCGGSGLNDGARCPACKGVGYHPTTR
jgi:hypothetical protein